MMKVWITSFYIILMFENVLFPYKNKPTGIIQWHKRDTAGLYLCFSFFFLNQRQLDACDVEAFTKVTFYPKNYTTSNYIL